ncbi:MAG TPA: transporter, partial [Gemmatimonadales bacterium]|nr:transporter [Gemmatimonadales bacterium]
YRLRDGDGLDPSVALLGGAVIPSGSSGVRAERVDPSFRIAAAHELGERVGVGYNLGVRGVSIRHGDGVVATEAEGIYTASVGVGLTDWLAVFGEAFGALALSSRAVEAHLVDAGVTLLLRHNLQLDFSGGKGYAGAAENWFVSAGVSIRLPR